MSAEPVPSETATAPAAAAAAVPGTTTTSADPVAPHAEESTTPAAPQPGAAPAIPAETAPAVPEPTPTATEKPQAEEEPQNPLTEKFTEAEWKALKGFRATLPSILAEAFPDKAEAKTTPIQLWGVTIDPNGAKDARASVILMKFLRARNLDVTEAKNMLVSTLRWRVTFKTDEVVNEEFPEVFAQLGKVYGHDKQGNPVTYNLYGTGNDLKAIFSDVQRFIRWRVAFMEKSIAQLDFETIDQMIQIHDYDGVSFFSRDTNSKSAASEATSLFQAHYPEFLSAKFFINFPSWLAWVFWLFKPLLSSATAAKMNMIGTGQGTILKALLPVIDKDQIPKRYGGAGEGF